MKQSPLNILFSPLFHSLSILHPPMRVSGNPFIVKLTGESLEIVLFLKFNDLQFCHSVFQWLTSSTEIHLSLLLITFVPKSLLVLFYLPNVILKLHLVDKLQVTLAYYIYYKRDFSYCQTLWIWEQPDINQYPETNILKYS